MKNDHCKCNKQLSHHSKRVRDETRDLTYAIGPFLGKGSFGKCFVMEDLRTGKAYAAKILDKKILIDPNQSCYLSEELAIHRLLRHKNIVKFYHAFEDSKFIYIMLELCTNGTLTDLQMRRKCITTLEAKYYLHHIINGVHYLHIKKHIVHGDLKLSNIFLNDNMEVKIGDFGLATAISYEGDEIRKLCGTPNYMAPEIVQRKGHSYAGDIWAIGCILYGLLVGRLPFESINGCGVYSKIKKCDFSVYEPGLRKQAATFIKKILQKDPENRPSIIALKQDEFMSGFIPSSLPEYTLWEPPLPKDLIPGNNRLTRIYSSSSKSKNSNRTMFSCKNVALNRRKQMKPSFTKIKYPRQIIVV